MAPMSRGSKPKPSHIVAPTISKKTRTASHRNHVFTSFSTRIARLKIAPLRSSRARPDLDEAAADLTSAASSYFATALAEWGERNLSAAFGAFADGAAPLAESLPMVLHHADALWALFEEAFAAADRFALEPLAALVGSFAHDLGPGFETYFTRAFALLASTAADGEQTVEGIEWCFGALAWCVKYMSRMLLEEGEMAAGWWGEVGRWLGRERQKPFIVRYMGEVVGFLLRRAGKDEVRIRRVMGWLVRDFLNAEEVGLCAEGLKVAVSEAVKGVGRGVHSAGVLVLTELVRSAYGLDDKGRARIFDLVVQGAIISVVHFTDQQGFQPIEVALLDQIENGDSTREHVIIAAGLVSVIAAARKGTRISDWDRLIKTTSRLVDQAAALEESQQQNALEAVLRALGNVFSAAPIHTAVKHASVLERTSRGPWTPHFLALCYFLAELSPDRFKTLLLKPFQKFVVDHWQDLEQTMLTLIPRLHSMQAFAAADLQCPEKWSNHMMAAFKDSRTGTKMEAATKNAYLRILESSMEESPETRKAIASALWSLLQAESGTPAHDTNPAESIFIHGQGFFFAASTTTPPYSLETLIGGDSGTVNLPLYWKALAASLEKLSAPSEFDPKVFDSVFASAIRTLRSPSHDLRVTAIQVLEQIYNLRSQPWPEICQVISSIENTPASIQNSRPISAQIRRLALLYKQTAEDDSVCQMVVSYCFGLLHFRLAQAWEDASQVLKEISSHGKAEELLLDIVSEWLDGGAEPSEQQTCDWDVHASQPAHSDFECVNVNQVEAHFSNSLLACKDSSAKLEAIFDENHHQISPQHPFNRIQALRVMKAVPQLAERKSRLLVPVLLQWVGRNAQDFVDDESGDPRWNRKDQKAMLDVFAQFQNPRVLFKSAEVYSALLQLVANGDVEIQKSALKALLSWKDPHVTRYEQHLFNFLDDARFREEISVFLRLDEEDGIREEDLEQLSPVLLRLLYGLLVNRSGNASGVRGKQSKRKAVFIALARFSDDILDQFIDIALEPLSSSTSEEDSPAEVHPRKQVGALNMLNDMSDALGGRLEPFAIQMGDVALSCVLAASKSKGDADDLFPSSDGSLLKVVRQTGFKCLEQLFKCCPELDWSRHAEAIVSNLLVPRFDNFATEFAQSLSGVLRLLSAWSLHPQTALYLVVFSQRILPELASCVTSEHAKQDIKKFVIDEIFAKLLDHYDGGVIEEGDRHMKLDKDFSEHTEITQQVLRPNAGAILQAISEMLKTAPTKDLLDSGVSCVSRLAGLIDQKEEARDFIHIATFLLKQPSAKVSFYTKRRLLSAIQHLIPATSLDKDDVLSLTVYEAISPLFAMVRDRPGRHLLCGVLTSLTSSIDELRPVAGLCDDLNSFATGKVDEPDFERRSKAFTMINEQLYTTFSPVQWRAVLHNMLYYIRDNDEVAIRASASFSLQRYIEAAVQDDNFKSDAFEDVTAKVLFPGLQHGMKDPSELVRIEYMAVLSALVKRMAFWTQVNDMVPLLASNDDEASFFLNILHVQQHRRLRAMRRLADQAVQGELSSSNVATVLWPLLEHFIFDAAQEESAHNLTAEAITTLCALTICLEWSQYKATLRRYIALMKSMEGKEKTTIRLIGSVIDGFYRTCTQGQTLDGEDKVMDDAPLTPKMSNLRKTMPKEEHLVLTITNQFLPPLTNFLHRKDESTVSLRVPVGVVMVKLMKCLPEQLMITKLPGMLLDLCHILRSRDQGSRDMTRKTLSEITALLGPAYFNFIIKELRSALQRGYQLHVLSFTLHSILVENLDKVTPGDLDHCLPELIAVIMDDIFGVAGQEKEAEDYISKMKEVKSSKSYDSMEILAKITTLEHLSQLIKPIRLLLQEKLDFRTVQKIDELLRRLALGVTSNNAVVDRNVLVFCYEIINLANGAKKPVAQNGKPFNDYKTRRYIIQMQAAHKSGKKGVTSSYTFKLVRFALDLLRSVLQKHEELKTPQNIAGFVPVISEALVSGQEEVQLSVIRLLTGIMRVPLPELESNASVYVSEAVKVIKAAPSMTNESAQAALKLISSALRDRSSTKIREIDLAHVLKRLKPDLEQPDRQGVIFNFLKSVVGRKIVITEVYEIMDAIAAIMVTNQTRQARELARGIYFQFMMDYPQGKDRLNKQVAFLIKNLEYAYPEGRQSVLELLHLLLQKTKGEVTQGVSSMTFVPLVMMLANDDNPECREMAGALIKQILDKAEDENRKTYTSLLRQWLEQDEQVLLKRLALQIWKMQTEVGSISTKDTDLLVRHIEAILPNGEDMIAQAEWEPLYYALQLFAEVAKASPEIAFSTKRNSLWNGVYRSLTFPHTWVKLSASRLVGVLFGDVGKTHKDIGLEQLPLHATNGLQLSDADLRRLCGSFMRVLRQQSSSEQLLAQTCRNIVFLSRVFAASGLEWYNRTPNSTDPADSASDQESGDDDDNEADPAAPATQPAALYLLSSLASILRRSPSSIDRATLPPKLAALQTLQALLTSLPAAQYTAILPSLLHPLLVQTDASIPKPTSSNPSFTADQARLTALAREALAAAQERVGSAAYVAAVTRAQGAIREAREERRQKRRIEKVADPEGYGRRKERRLEGKERRKKREGERERGKRRGW